MKFDEHLIKERTRHLEKISNMDYEFFLLLSLKWSLVNTDQESSHECNFFCWRSREIVTVLFESEFK